jgi:hypothetical protein
LCTIQINIRVVYLLADIFYFGNLLVYVTTLLNIPRIPLDKKTLFFASATLFIDAN